MAGQITIDTPFGVELRRLAAERDCRVILDVGTWAGCGTTLCLLLGVLEGGGHGTIFSVEANQKMAEGSKRIYDNWLREHRRGKKIALPAELTDLCEDKKLKLTQLPINFFWGRICERTMSVPEILMHPLFDKVRAHWRLNGQAELDDCAAAPKLDFKLDVDLAVLDGGEFCGWYDWLALEKMGGAKIVALDDTRVMKNARVLEHLRAAGWQTLAEGEDRNGWAILKRPAGDARPLAPSLVPS